MDLDRSANRRSRVTTGLAPHTGIDGLAMVAAARPGRADRARGVGKETARRGPKRREWT
jgi:hypothetical protein